MQDWLHLPGASRRPTPALPCVRSAEGLYGRTSRTRDGRTRAACTPHGTWLDTNLAVAPGPAWSAWRGRRRHRVRSHQAVPSQFAPGLCTPRDPQSFSRRSKRAKDLGDERAQSRSRESLAIVPNDMARVWHVSNCGGAVVDEGLRALVRRHEARHPGGSPRGKPGGRHRRGPERSGSTSPRSLRSRWLHAHFPERRRHRYGRRAKEHMFWCRVPPTERFPCRSGLAPLP